MKNADDKFEAADSGSYTIIGTKDKNKVMIVISDSPSDSNMKSMISIVIDPITE